MVRLWLSVVLSTQVTYICVMLHTYYTRHDGKTKFDNRSLNTKYTDDIVQSSPEYLTNKVEQKSMRNHSQKVKQLKVKQTDNRLKKFNINHKGLTQTRTRVYTRNQKRTTAYMYNKTRTPAYSENLEQQRPPRSKSLHTHEDACGSFVFRDDISLVGLYYSTCEWRMVSGDNKDVIVYSAYWDNRFSPPTVRILGVDNMLRQHSRWCLLWFEGEREAKIKEATIKPMAPSHQYK